MTSHAPLTPAAHATLRVRTERSAALGDAVMSAVLVPSEFRSAQNDYPILFRRDQTHDRFSAIALFGFETGENLFLDDGGWDARYRPLAIEIAPFLIGRAAPDSEVAQVHIDMASPRVGGDEGVRVFDAQGRATPYLETIAERLGALDIGMKEADAFLAALRRHDLLEPLTLEVTLADGAINRLVGFHTIDEDALRALDAAALGELHAAGHLLPIFMAIASLANIGDLVARRNRRGAHG